MFIELNEFETVKRFTSATFQLYKKKQTKLTDSIFLPSNLERKFSHPDDRQECHAMTTARAPRFSWDSVVT